MACAMLLAVSAGILIGISTKFFLHRIKVPYTALLLVSEHYCHRVLVATQQGSSSLYICYMPWTSSELPHD